MLKQFIRKKLEAFQSPQPHLGTVKIVFTKFSNLGKNPQLFTASEYCNKHNITYLVTPGYRDLAAGLFEQITIVLQDDSQESHILFLAPWIRINKAAEPFSINDRTPAAACLDMMSYHKGIRHYSTHLFNPSVLCVRRDLLHHLWVRLNRCLRDREKYFSGHKIVNEFLIECNAQILSEKWNYQTEFASTDRKTMVDAAFINKSIILAPNEE